MFFSISMRRYSIPLFVFLFSCFVVGMGQGIVSLSTQKTVQAMQPFGGFDHTNERIIPDHPDTITSVLTTPILMYHYVEYVKDENDTIRQSLDTLPSTLERQIQTFLDHGYTFLTMGELSSVLSKTDILPQKRVVLTFDDGYKDFFTDVLPLLQKYHIKATVYVIGGSIGKLNYMTQADIKEAFATGLVEIGAHTMTHPNLKGKSEQELEKEILGSKQLVEALIESPVVSFCYPYGAYDDRAKAMVATSGFTNATITPIASPRMHDAWSIDRIRPGNFFGTALLNHVNAQIAKRSLIYGT